MHSRLITTQSYSLLYILEYCVEVRLLATPKLAVAGDFSALLLYEYVGKKVITVYV